jgi:hypothetical protein
MAPHLTCRQARAMKEKLANVDAATVASLSPEEQAARDAVAAKAEEAKRAEQARLAEENRQMSMRIAATGSATDN